ncbi:hypothetical protein AOLI_G00237490 [Acnodon oligacanthus]
MILPISTPSTGPRRRPQVLRALHSRAVGDAQAGASRTGSWSPLRPSLTLALPERFLPDRRPPCPLLRRPAAPGTSEKKQPERR